MNFADFLRVVRARWVLALSTFLAIVILALLANLLWPKSYRAKAAVMIDMKVDPVAGTSAVGLMPSAAYLATQVDILESGYVAQRVVRTLQLEQNALMREEWMSKTGGKGDLIAWLGDKIAEKLKVEEARESNVIDISYESPDPKFAAAMANAYAKAYIESTVQIRTSPARQYSDFFEERAKIARQKMETAQNKLSEAQKEKGILVTDEKLDVETAKLNDLSNQLTTLRGVVADAGSRKAQAAVSGEVAPDAMASTIVASLKSDLARLEAKLDESLERYGENHPLIVELKTSIASTRAKIRAEVNRVSGSLSAANQIGMAREAAIQKAYEEQRQRLLKLKQDRNDLQVLERDVLATQRVFDAIQSRKSQMSLEGSNGQTNVVILNTASEPLTPSSPKTTLNMVIAGVLALMLAAAVTLVMEFLDRRVRGATDLATLIELPVIGVLSTVGPQGKLASLLGKPAIRSAVTSSRSALKPYGQQG
jgi:succinoglycan biosynthesis transport protein ExoP